MQPTTISAPCRAKLVALERYSFPRRSSLSNMQSQFPLANRMP